MSSPEPRGDQSGLPWLELLPHDAAGSPTFWGVLLGLGFRVQGLGGVEYRGIEGPHDAAGSPTFCGLEGVGFG